MYYIGNLVRDEFLTVRSVVSRYISSAHLFYQKFYGLAFMKPLIEDMVHVDPTIRPPMDEVVLRFKDIYKSLGWWKLRARLVGRREFWTLPHRTVRYLGNTMRSMTTLKPALPFPSAREDGRAQ